MIFDRAPEEVRRPEENLALYPAELRAFLDRGGSICWGIVPNNEEIRDVTPQGLAGNEPTGAVC